MNIKNKNKKTVLIDAELGVYLAPGQVMTEVIPELAEKALKIKGVVEVKKGKAKKKGK